jgi:hypothetical protein
MQAMAEQLTHRHNAYARVERSLPGLQPVKDRTSRFLPGLDRLLRDDFRQGVFTAFLLGELVTQK